MDIWREMIERVMKENGDTMDGAWVNVEQNLDRCYDDEDIANAPPASIDREFDGSFGGTYGDYFTVWTDKWVYFPVCYDGAESVGSVMRNPTKGYASEHHGGG